MNVSSSFAKRKIFVNLSPPDGFGEIFDTIFTTSVLDFYICLMPLAENCVGKEKNEGAPER